MKKTLLYLSMMLLAAAGFSSCENDWVTPPIVGPDASEQLAKVNTTIAELKEKYYNTNAKSYEVIGTNDNGEDIWIAGRVVSSTEAGNVYKAIYLEDETAAIQIRLNSSSVYQLYQYGQEVVVNCTGLGIGNYGGLLQIGGDINNGTPGYINEDVYETHIFANGLAAPEKIEIPEVTISELLEISKDPMQALMWQCRLVRINDVSIQGGGFAPYADVTSSYSTERYVGNEEGKLILYNSAYSTFAEEIMPMGTGSITALLSSYSGRWQLIINSTADLEGFLTEVDPADIPSFEPEGEGTLASPYNVARARELVKSGNLPTGTVYIKGVVCYIEDFSSSYGNMTYDISDSGQTIDMLKVYQGFGLNGDKFTSASDLKEGDVVVVSGKLVDYNGTPELERGNKIISLNGSGESGPSTGPDTPDTPDVPEGNATFRKATSITSGKAYVMVTSAGQVSIPIKEAYTYGYLYVEDPVSTSGDQIVTSAANGIVFTKEAEGYTMVDCYGRYLGMDDTHTSFQLYTSAGTGCYWNVTFSGTDASIVNTSRSLPVVWSDKYSNFCPGESGALPTLYEKID